MSHSSFTNSDFRCHACASERSAYSFRGRGEFEFIKCGDCGLGHTQPMPSDAVLNEYYQGFSFERPSVADLERTLPDIISSLAKLIGPAEGNACFLDYGGSSGIYCLAAQRLGWTPYLFDLDGAALDFARRELKLGNVYGELDALSSKKFSVIFAFHVVEHWNDLTASMEKLIDLLDDDGRLVIATPNSDSVEKFFRPKHLSSYYRRIDPADRSFFRRWHTTLRRNSFFCWDPPRHLYCFTPKSFRAIAARYNCIAEIKVGYNSDVDFEPRNYVIPNARNAFRMMKQEIAGRGVRLSVFSRFLKRVFQSTSVRLLSWVVPSGGEQLYLVLRKIKNPS